MEAAGMCHSDHHLVTGDIPMAGFPVLGGHEGAGIVTEVGPGVEDIAPGDHVVCRSSHRAASVRRVRPACATCAIWACHAHGAAVSDGTFRVTPTARTSTR